MTARNPYPPIRDYAFISNAYSAALVSRAGSIDWCCTPRFDSSPVFGRLVDWEHGGFCSVAPTDKHASTRAYVGNSLVLATRFECANGEFEVRDCFAVVDPDASQPTQRLLRVVEGCRGRPSVRVHVAPRFDYAEVRPWLRHHRAGVHTAIGGNDALIICCDQELNVVDTHDLVAECKLRPGERLRLSISYAAPESVGSDLSPPTPADLDAQLDATIAWWEDWSAKGTITGPYAPEAIRSAIVLKGLTYAPSGAVVAAPTTSLPEALGGDRNWDYRYSWIRDSHFTVRALAELGFDAEADAFRRFIERSAAASVDSLQIMYGVGGERRLSEEDLVHLDGYRGCRPVRVGNAAARQQQFDVFGDLLDLSWQWHTRGQSPDDDYWRFLVSVVDYVATHWRDPDQGIWETRTRPKHFLYSKAMCLVALDRGLDLARDCLRSAPLETWERERDGLRHIIDRDGFNRRRNTFTQTLKGRTVDAALLLLPEFGVVDYEDPRMVGTVDAVQADLVEDGLVRRYTTQDSLRGTEGAFLPCSFWLAECLARQGRVGEATEMFDNALAAANDAGLFSEEFDASHERALGNFPQALTHLSHISAAVALTEAAP